MVSLTMACQILRAWGITGGEAAGKALVTMIARVGVVASFAESVLLHFLFLSFSLSSFRNNSHKSDQNCLLVFRCTICINCSNILIFVSQSSLSRSTIFLSYIGNDFCGSSEFGKRQFSRSISSVDSVYLLNTSRSYFATFSYMNFSFM